MIDRLRDGRGDLRRPRHVHLQRQRPSAERADGVGDVTRRAQVAKPERHVGAGLGQGDGDGPADATRGASHQRDPAGDVEGGRGARAVGVGGRVRRFAHSEKLSRNRLPGAT
jgi:hypothetical protein